MSWLLMHSRRLAKHGDIARVVYELLRNNTIFMILKRSSEELLLYDMILKPSSDNFTTIFLRVSAITVRLSMSCLQISTSWENIIGLAH